MRRREFVLGVLAAPGGGRVRVGCQTRAYGSPIRDRAKLLAVLEDLAAAGYEGFETNHQSLAHSFTDPEPMRREIEKRRIEMIGLHFSAGLFDPARIEQEQSQLGEVARATRALGGGWVVLSSGKVPPEGLERRCRELNRAGRALREIGVRLCFHNHTHELEDGARHLKTVLAGTDPELVSMVLDVGNRFPPEYPAVQAAKEHLSRIAGFHLRDTVQGEEVRMGTGEFDFAALGKVIRGAGWSGWLIVEVNQRQDVASRGYVEEIRGFLRRTMGV
jgi:sugar phosphate isomerase/epimerase